MAAVNKRWWLKLESDFPSSPTMRLIERKFGGGGAYIYIKMMLASLRQQDQEFLCRGFGEDIVDLIAAVIYEDPDEVKAVYDFAVKRGEIEEGENEAGEKYCIMIQAAKLSGGESDSAERVRRSRARKEQAKALQCNGDSLQSNGKALQCNSEALQTGGNKNKSKSNSKSKSKNKSQNESNRESESEKENYSNSESKNYSKTRAGARENEPGGSSWAGIHPKKPGSKRIGLHSKPC